MSASLVQRATFRACPICRGERADVLHRQSFVLPEGHPLEDGYDVVCCETCGFVYADTQVDQDAYERYYADSSKYADVATGTGGGDLEWDARRLRETAELIAQLVPLGEEAIVDVGCANGGLLKYLSSMGARRLIGVDPSPACVQMAQRVPGVTGLVGSLFDLPAAVRGVQCIILSHVLEHVREVAPALATVRERLAPGGLLYVEVPDATRYAEHLVAPLQDFNTEHINHFSLRSLRTALTLNGFVVSDEGQKTIEASAGVPYPALWIAARRADDARAATNAAIPYDHGLRADIDSYIRASLRQVEAIDQHLRRELADADRIVVWGAGQTTLKLLGVTMLRHRDIVAFVDTNPILHGKRLRGAPIVGPDSLADFPEPILVGSLISREPIARRIRELGLPNRVIFLNP
jgi:SAM-dependent methyltransferase